jgi:hypothetical protein
MPTDVRINRELTHKSIEGGEFHEFTRLFGIRIDRVVVRQPRDAIGSERGTHRSAQVTCIRENDPSCSLIGGGTGVGYRKGLVVGFPCNEQSVDALIVTAAQLPFRSGSQFTPSKSRSGIRTVSRLEVLVHLGRGNSPGWHHADRVSLFESD